MSLPYKYSERNPNIQDYVVEITIPLMIQAECLHDASMAAGALGGRLRSHATVCSPATLCKGKNGSTVKIITRRA